MKASDLTVIATHFNPLRWKKTAHNFRTFCEHVLDSGANLVVAEVTYGEREFEFVDIPHIKHIPLRSSTPAWCKENAQNAALHRTPEAKYIAFLDGDIRYRKSGWAGEIVEALQIYHWLQPWSQCLDLGPHGEVNAVFRSFAHQYEIGAPLIPDKHGWKSYGCGTYPHPGFAHAASRRILDQTGGLFELAAMGAGDHSLCLSLVGMADKAVPKGFNSRYVEELMAYQDRIQHAVHGRLGYIHQVIEHMYHGSKSNRGYLDRWQMFIRENFDPSKDLKRNANGILEWSGRNRHLERLWMGYLRSRREDSVE